MPGPEDIYENANVNHHAKQMFRAYHGMHESQLEERWRDAGQAERHRWCDVVLAYQGSTFDVVGDALSFEAALEAMGMPVAHEKLITAIARAGVSRADARAIVSEVLKQVDRTKGEFEQPAPEPVAPSMTTTDGRSVDEVRAEQSAEGNKLHRSYIVLTEEERAKGFVRPVRQRYKHVGIRPKFELLPLTEEQKAKNATYGYVGYEAYPVGSPEKERGLVGRYWTQAQLDSGCGGITIMGLAIAETYARKPDFYGATMCVHCGAHYPVGEHGEFVWIERDGSEGPRVGT